MNYKDFMEIFGIVSLVAWLGTLVLYLISGIDSIRTYGLLSLSSSLIIAIIFFVGVAIALVFFVLLLLDKLEKIPALILAVLEIIVIIAIIIIVIIAFGFPEIAIMLWVELGVAVLTGVFTYLAVK